MFFIFLRYNGIYFLVVFKEYEYLKSFMYGIKFWNVENGDGCEKMMWNLIKRGNINLFIFFFIKF